jgi:hypothetical protein
MEAFVHEHKFKIGQSVRFASGRTSKIGIYKMTQLLPAERDDCQYRIKGTNEPHKRVVRESQLNRIA